MKKAIALSFLLLASIVVLAHAVIPHHHHNQIPVVVCNNHHELESTTNRHHHHNDTHPIDQCADPDGHCHGVIEDCLLAKVFVRVSYDKQASQSLGIDFNLLPCIVSLFSGYSIPEIDDDIGLPFRQKPYLLSYHTEYISVSLGLRAPPVC